MPDTIIHLRLEEKLWRKLKNLARLSRRKQSDVIRFLIDEATAEQLGVPKKRAAESA